MVLDPFCGTGTTGIAALALGRRFTGIDLSPEFAAIAAERLRHAAAQPPGNESGNDRRHEVSGMPQRHCRAVPQKPCSAPPKRPPGSVRSQARSSARPGGQVHQHAH